MIRSIYLSSFVLFILSCFVSSGQKEIVLTRKMNIKVHDPAYSIEACAYSLLVPANSAGRQKVLEYKYSITPDNVVKNELNQYYLKWKRVTFSEVRKKDIRVVMKIRINTYDLTTAKKNPVIDKADLDTMNYLKDEENFRASSKIIVKASEQVNDSSREKTVKQIFDYVISSMEYCIFEEQDRGAKRALREGKGDCTEYSELMVTLCRAKKIPARIAEGLIPHTDGTIGYHNWVEVFFPVYGWVSFDPTWADHKGSKTTFDKMLNSYIKLGNQRFTRHIYCSCSTAQYSFEYRISDSCSYSSGSVEQLVKTMLNHYNLGNNAEALKLLDTLLILDPNNNLYWNFKGITEVRLGKKEEALRSLNSAMENASSSGSKKGTLYAFSNYYGIMGDKENAVKYLKEAIDNGFKNYDHIKNDTDLKNLKGYEPFEELLKELKQKITEDKK
jgi:tetratricopeptide (TPR) repeat protein